MADEQDQPNYFADFKQDQPNYFSEFKPSEEPVSTTRAVLTGAGAQILPTVGGLAAAGAGAELGASLGALTGPAAPVAVPVLGFAGGVAGMLGGGALTEKIQEAALERFPGIAHGLGLSPEEQRAAQIEHPIASFVGGLAPAVATMSPRAALRELPEGATALQRVMASPYTARLFGGAMFGGLQLGQDMVVNGEPDWVKAGIAAGVGAALPGIGKAGQAISEIGGRPARNLAAALTPRVRPAETSKALAATVDQQAMKETEEAGEVAIEALQKGVLEPTLDTSWLDRNSLNGARAGGLLGEGEEGAIGFGDATDEVVKQRLNAAGDITIPPRAPTLDDIAQSLDPIAFADHGRLTAQVGIFRRWIDQLNATPEPEQTEALQRLQEQETSLLAKVNGVEARLTKKQTERLTAIREERNTIGVTPPEGTPRANKLQTARKYLMKTDEQLRDLGPRIFAARAEAARQLGVETVETPTTAETGAPVEEAKPTLEALGLNEAEKAVVSEAGVAKAGEAKPLTTFTDWAEEVQKKQQEAPILARGEPSTESLAASKILDLAQRIKKEQALKAGVAPEVVDVSGHLTPILVRAGLSPEVAEASAQVVAARYQALSETFAGRKGTAWDLYNKEMPLIQGETRELGGVFATLARGRMPEGLPLEQARRGGVKLADGLSLITLFEKADPSTFMHELAHKWLAETAHYANDPDAPAQLRDDLVTIQKQFGIENAAKIGVRSHELFARSFERYLREGVAPSKELAGVFAKFKQWLTTIYQAVRNIGRTKINEDIRSVFDQMLAAKPERTIIDPTERLRLDISDIHAHDAKTIPPHQADLGADQIRNEVDRLIATHLSEHSDALIQRTQEQVERDNIQKSEDEAARNAARNGPGEGGMAENAGEKHPGRAGAKGKSGKLAGTAREVGEGGLGGVGGTTEGGERGALRGNESADRTRNDRPGIGGKLGANPYNEFQRDASGKVLAGNIRLENLNTSDDLNHIIQGFVSEWDSLNEARNNDRSWAWHAEVMAARKAFVDIAHSTKASLDHYLETEGDEVAEKSYMQWAERMRLVSDHLASLTAGWGRAGLAFRKMTDVKAYQDLDQLVKRMTGKTRAQAKAAAAAAGQMDTMEELDKQLYGTFQASWLKFKSRFIEYYLSSLLSGPITHAAYATGIMTSNLFKATVVTPTAAMTGEVGHLLGGEAPAVTLGEAKARLFGVVSGTIDGIVPAWKAWKSGAPHVFFGDVGTLPGEEMPTSWVHHEIPGTIGNILHYPFDAIQAVHTLNRFMSYASEKNGLIYQQAVSEGLEGDALAARIAALKTDTTSEIARDISRQASAEAYKMTLMNRAKWGSLTWQISNITNSILPLKLFAPFVQIGMNLVHEGVVAMTPIGLLEQRIRDDCMGRNGKAAQEFGIAKIAAGTMLSTAVGGMAANGQITGPGPSEPAKRRVWMLAGNQPFSVKIGDTWYPYRKWLGPLGPLLGTAATLGEAAGHLSDSDTKEVAKTIVIGLSEAVADETWFRGIAELVDTVSHPETTGKARLRNLVSSMIPFSVGANQIARAIDPYQRHADNLLQAIEQKIPWVSEGLRPAYDVWGQPLPSRTQVTPSQVSEDPTNKELWRLEYGMTMPEKAIRGVSLTPEQYDEYCRIAGRATKFAVDKLIQNPAYERLPDAIRREQIGKQIASAREIARNRIIFESVNGPNDILRQATKKKMGMP